VVEAVTGEGDVVLGREQRDQAENQAADGLNDAMPIKDMPCRAPARLGW
jgi:hypothetical protein